MSKKLVFAGARTVIGQGDSIMVSLPKKEVQELGHDPEDLVGQTIMTQMNDEGEFRADLGTEIEEDSVLTIDAD